MKKFKMFIISVCLIFTLVPNLTLKNVNALEYIEMTEGSITLDLNNIKIGDSLTVYENPITGGKLIIDFLPVKSSRLNTGTGSWSSGTIPSSTVTMFPHYDDPNRDYSEIGFYVTYDGRNKKILDTYGESIGCLNGEISNIDSRIVYANATSSNYAKSQMSWTYKSSGASLLLPKTRY